MCDACVNAMREVVESLTPAQRSAIDAFVEHESHEMIEEAAEEVDNLKEQMDEASALVIELRDLLSEKILNGDTTVNELLAHVTNYERALTLIDEIGTKLERTA